MKKIAIVANSTWNIFNFRQDLIRTLKGQNFRVLAIAPVDEYISYLNENLFIKHIPISNLSPQGKNPLRDYLLYRELKAIYKKEKPDVILHYTVKPNVYGGVAAAKLNIPYICTVTGLGSSFIEEDRVPTAMTKLYKASFKKAFKVVFHNPDDHALFLKNKLIKEESSAVVLGSGVNTEIYAPVYRPIQEKFVFLFTGRLLRDKGIVEFVKAARRAKSLLPRSTFWVVGPLQESNPNSISKGELLQWVEEGTIKYLGSQKNIKDHIAMADVFVLPSYREGLPKSVIEAMAMAKPIITTDVPGCRTTVYEGENGFLVPSKDERALSEAMMKMYNLSDVDLTRMGKKSRELTLDKFDREIVNTAYLDFIYEALGKQKKLSLEKVRSD